MLNYWGKNGHVIDKTEVRLHRRNKHNGKVTFFDVETTNIL